MDRNALDWLFSTAPQALAALVGLIFAGVSFIISAIDKEVERDETRADIAMEMKNEIHGYMKRLFWLAGISILADLILLIINPIQEDIQFSFNGTFNLYFLIAGIILTINIAAFCYSLWFIIKVARPNFFEITVKRLSKAISNGDVDVKDFIMEYVQFEKSLRLLPIFNDDVRDRSVTVSEMLRKLRYYNVINKQDIDQMYNLTRTRNLIIHQGEITHVSKSTINEMKRCTNLIKGLNNKL